MLDLCKFLDVLDVKEEEEFRISVYGDSSIYRFHNGELEYYDDVYDKWKSALISVNAILDSEITKLPKKKQFSQDMLNFFKCIDKKFEWIAKDRNGEVYIYTNKPKKIDVYWIDSSSESLSFKPLDVFKNSLFTEIKWEDEEPVRIDDYVDRENEVK